MTPLLLLGLLLAGAPSDSSEQAPTSWPDPGPERDRLSGSVGICYADETKARALAAIRDERAAAKYGGVVSKSRLYDLQRLARNADVSRARNVTFLRDLRLKPLACSRPDLRYYVACLVARDGGELACEDDGAWVEFAKWTE